MATSFKTPQKVKQKWGVRSISVSADEGVLKSIQHDGTKESLMDPMAFDDRDDSEDDAPPFQEVVPDVATSDMSSGDVWREESTE